MDQSVGHSLFESKCSATVLGIVHDGVNTLDMAMSEGMGIKP